MKKVFLIGKLNEILKELGELLSSESCQVQLCPDNQEILEGLLKMIFPDVAVVSLLGSRATHQELISLLLRDCPGAAVVVIGSRGNEKELEDGGCLPHPRVCFICRPVTTREIVRQIKAALAGDIRTPPPKPKADPGEKAGAEPGEKAGAEPAEEPAPRAGEHKTILVVDDSPAMLRTMQAMLSKRYRVIFATSGAQAIALTAKELPDLILLDYEMPVVNGKMTLEMLRSEESTRDIPVVFLTGMDDADHVHEVLALKPQGYLLKPPLRGAHLLHHRGDPGRSIAARVRGSGTGPALPGAAGRRSGQTTTKAKGVLDMDDKKRRQLVAILYGVILAVTVFLVVRFGANPQKDALRVGFITPGSVEVAGWSSVTYQGVVDACKSLGAELLLRADVTEYTGACPQAVEELAREGADMIILNSISYAQEMRELLADYPGIFFYGSSSEYEAANLKSFSTRLYQARYLSGIVAGAQTRTNKLGFVAAHRQNAIIRGIDAFALGAQRVNPDAEVIVCWTNSWEDRERETAAVQALVREENVDVVTYHQDRSFVVEAADAAGIYSIGYYQEVEGATEKCLTSAVCDWGPLFEAIIRDYLRSSGANTGWMGLGSGVVGLTEYSPLVPQSTRDEVEEATQEILNGYNMFSGLIYDNQGNQRCGEGEAVSDETLQKNIDWLVKGVREYEN